MVVGFGAIIMPIGLPILPPPLLARSAAAVSLGVSREDLEKFFGTVTAAGRITNDWTVEEEQDLTVYVCEQPRESLQSLWPKLAGRN